jgi:hypothetical protein
MLNQTHQRPTTKGKTMTSAKDYTYGIELECLVKTETVNRTNLRIGSYHHGIQVPFLPRGWKAERDASIRTPQGYQACEIVSPVLKGEEGILEVIAVLKKLNELGFKVNETCGVHIHVGYNSDWGADVLARLISTTSYLEKGLFAITGTKKRERGTYCKGIRKHGDAPKAKEKMNPDRYNSLNITNLANRNSRQQTVEFRVFSGSLNEVKIVGWIQTCLGIVERAVNSKRTPKWEPNAPSGGWKKDGDGQSETERMLGFLAWGKGYARIHGGKQYGWISDAIPQETVKAEFRRLAKKYDAEP